MKIHAGFIPLVDCAPLVAARELGFASEEGIDLHLHREVSWANIRDKINVGFYDCAHMLAPMPLAATCGIGHVQEQIIAPVALSLNGNAITVSNAVFAAMLDTDADNARAGGSASAIAMSRVIHDRANAGEPPLTFGIVYPFSCHNYELRQWLANANIDPDHDVRIVGLPPSLMAESLKAGHIQGFCAGEPWNSVAVERGVGRILTTKQELWGLAPEKVLGVRDEWARGHRDALEKLIRAICRAAAWLDERGNRIGAAEMLSRKSYLDLPGDIIARSLTNTIVRGGDTAPETSDDFIVFAKYNANQPSVSHAMWLLTQMARWGNISSEFAFQPAARHIYAADIYARALGQTTTAETEIDRATRAAARFDPTDIATYLQGFDICTDRARLAAIARAQVAIG